MTSAATDASCALATLSLNVRLTGAWASRPTSPTEVSRSRRIPSHERAAPVTLAFFLTHS